MADEPQVITVFRFICEVIWTLLRLNFELVIAFVRWCIPPAPKDVSNEIILVTGAGHGMGREMALRFARLGATVIVADINPAGNEETFKMIKEEKGTAYKYECDVTDRAGVFKMAEKIKKDVGDVTILVNNAGIMPCKPLLRQSEQEIKAVMAINVNGNLWTLQAFLPAMLERNYGHIVAMSSMAGQMGLRNLVPYCGSKFAARGIMEALTVELHEDPRPTDGIKFTTVCPYIVNTGLCQKPRIRFPALMKPVNTADAADQIVNAVRRNYSLITIPSDLHYTNKIFTMLPVNAGKVMIDFLQTGMDPDD